MRLEGAGLVDKADSITRLNRNDGVGNIFITHSLRDMQSMSSEADNMKARGFAERSGIVVTAGLAKEDLRALSEVKRMSEIEINTVAGWSTPPGLAASTRPRRGRTETAGTTAGRGESADQDRRPGRDPNPGEAHPDRTRPARHERPLAAGGGRPDGHTRDDATGDRTHEHRGRPRCRRCSWARRGLWACSAPCGLVHRGGTTGSGSRSAWSRARHRSAPLDKRSDGGSRCLGGLLLVVVFAVIFMPGASGSGPTARPVTWPQAPDLRHLTAAGAARKLSVGGARSGLPSQACGRPAAVLRWEDMMVLIAGPRTMKTSSYAIPTCSPRLAPPGHQQ